MRYVLHITHEVRTSWVRWAVGPGRRKRPSRHLYNPHSCTWSFLRSIGGGITYFLPFIPFSSYVSLWLSRKGHHFAFTSSNVAWVHSPRQTVSVHLDDARHHINTYMYFKGERYDETSRGRGIRGVSPHPSDWTRRFCRCVPR
jgi:hypothetical protein